MTGDYMKVLIVVGSRREGNSFVLANKLKTSLENARIANDIIIPGNQKIYLCTGCMDCDRNGVCDFKDDMVANIEKVASSDYIVFITPVRWDLLSGDLKIFMDRLNPLFSTRQMKGKKMIAIIVGSKKRTEYSTDGALTSLGSFASSAGMSLVYSSQFDECLNFGDVLKYEDKINKMCEDIIKLIDSE